MKLFLDKSFNLTRSESGHTACIEYVLRSFSYSIFTRRSLRFSVVLFSATLIFSFVSDIHAQIMFLKAVK